MIKHQLNLLLNSIAQPDTAYQSTKLLAVSKTWSADTLKEAYLAGQRSFGENYLQEALIKVNTLSDLDIEWHFIGPIQSNKTKEIAHNFDWVQSIDRIKIAQRLSTQRPKAHANLNVCIQVNIDNEANKSGVHSDNVLDLAQQIAQFDNLMLRGLMIIPKNTDNPNEKRHSFQKAHHLFIQLSEMYPSVDTLSMGMSGDMKLAISEGSTMVRVGTALFGQRHSTIK